MFGPLEASQDAHDGTSGRRGDGAALHQDARDGESDPACSFHSADLVSPSLESPGL